MFSACILLVPLFNQIFYIPWLFALVVINAFSLWWRGRKIYTTHLTIKKNSLLVTKFEPFSVCFGFCLWWRGHSGYLRTNISISSLYARCLAVLWCEHHYFNRRFKDGFLVSWEKQECLGWLYKLKQGGFSISPYIIDFCDWFLFKGWPNS